MRGLAERAAEVAELLKARKQRVGVAESSAGGLISACLLATPGASTFYLGGAVIYTRRAFSGLLQVPSETIKDMRGACEPWALLKARSLRERLGCDWALAEAGAAGPTGNRYGDAAGHTAFAVAGPVERTRVLETGSADREANMWAFADGALALLAECLREAK
jgi:PncC family amidohydrolase